MKTAEEILKSKLDGKITFVNNPDYTFNKVIEAMEEYRLQSHTSPMSAEQVDWESFRGKFFKQCTHNDSMDGCMINTNIEPSALFEWFKHNLPVFTAPSVKADGWVSVEDELPKVGQKVDLWLVPDDEEKSYRMTWTWEKESTARITINGCKVTHWQPLPAPPKQ